MSVPITAEAYKNGPVALETLERFRDELYKDQETWDDADREMVDQVYKMFAEKQKMMNCLIRMISARCKVLMGEPDLVKYFPELMTFFAQKHNSMLQLQRDGIL